MAVLVCSSEAESQGKHNFLKKKSKIYLIFCEPASHNLGVKPWKVHFAVSQPNKGPMSDELSVLRNVGKENNDSGKKF